MNNDIILTILHYLRHRYTTHEIRLSEGDPDGPNIRITNHTNLQLYLDLDGSNLHLTHCGHYRDTQNNIASDGLKFINTIDLTHPDSIQQLTDTLDHELHHRTKAPKRPA